jgi:aspartate-semialdehyde dehydrogenase
MKLALIGASGLVGSEYLRIIAADRSGVDELAVLASKRSAGSTLRCGKQELTVQDLAEYDFSGTDYALFCVGDELSRKYVPPALKAGVRIVDKSNAYRMQPDVPLVVGGLNDETVNSQSKLVANPNCSTILLCHALKSLKRFGIRRIWVATYQSTSGAGRAGIQRLQEQLRESRLDPASGRSNGSEDNIAYNVLPGIGGYDEKLRCSEESKLLNESRKILDLPELPLIAHAVRVPVSVGHSMAVSVEFDRSITRGAFLEAWESDNHIMYCSEGLPGPLSASRHVSVEAGRLRREEGLENGWSFFISGDNLSLGAALNGWRLLHLLRTQSDNLETKAG